MSTNSNQHQPVIFVTVPPDTKNIQFKMNFLQAETFHHLFIVNLYFGLSK